MINGTRLKVCGLTSVVDAQAADKSGADYLGFILYPKSARYLPLEKFREMKSHLPVAKKKVAVVVEPELEQLPALLDEGFDIVQLHFSIETPFFQVALWSDAIPAEKLWFAPRVANRHELDPAFIPLANTILFDAYDPNSFGGTGKTSDWDEFVHLRDKYTRPQWVLSGGLKAENIGDAIKATHANFVDVNSGVEASPGVKDHAKLRAFVAALQHATTNNGSTNGA